MLYSLLKDSDSQHRVFRMTPLAPQPWFLKSVAHPRGFRVTLLMLLSWLHGSSLLLKDFRLALHVLAMLLKVPKFVRLARQF